MTNKANQKTVVARMRELLAEWNVKNRSSYYHDAVEHLEFLAGRPKARKKRRSAREGSLSEK